MTGHPATSNQPRYVGDVEVEHRDGRRWTIDDLTTLFHLVVLVIDARRAADSIDALAVYSRIDAVLGDANVNLDLLTVGDAVNHADLAAHIDRFATRGRIFIDTTGGTAHQLGVITAPTLLWVNAAACVEASVERWTPATWRALFHPLADVLAWTRPQIPVDDDPDVVLPQPLAAVPNRPAPDPSTESPQAERNP